MKGVFLDLETLGDDYNLAALEACVEQWTLHQVSAQDEVASRIADADVIVSNKTMIDAAAMESAGNLKLICVAATGTNNVDLDAAARIGIQVCNVTAYGTPSVAQHVFSLILALTTRLIEYRAAVRAGRWSQSPHFCMLDYPIAELDGKVLGIVGHGELGGGVARLGEAFGMQVKIAQRPGTGPSPGRVPLDQLLAEVDVLSLHCPLTPATEGLIGAAELASMKPTALLINTARGGIVDEPALADALRRGVIGGAGMDVLTTEPPVDGNPLLADDIPNLIVTPHIAWAARESRQRVLDQIADNIRSFRAGALRNRVA